MTPPAGQSGGALKVRVASSIVWTSVRFGGDILTNVIVFAILARILQPAQFGAFVVSIVFAEVGRLAVTNGLVSSIYGRTARDARTNDVIFWGNLGIGVAFAALGVAASPWLATILGVVETTDVIAATSLIVPITALGATHSALKLRDFGHRALALRTLVAGVISSALTVAAALNGYGVWALVIQRLTTEIIYTISAWASYRWTPRLRWSWRVLRRQFILGGGVLSAQTVALGLNRSQDIILSRVLGLGAVGVYRTGWKIIEQLIQGASAPFATVLAPTLNTFSDRPAEFERAFLKTVAICAICAFPAITGFATVANQVIPVLFGDRWAESVPLAQILGLLFFPATLSFFIEPALLVRNRPGPLLALAILQCVVTIGLGVAAAPYGLFAFAVAYVIRSYLILIVQLFVLHKVVRIRALAVLRPLVAPTLASASMVLVILGVRRLLPPTDAQSLFLKLLVLQEVVLAGAASYAIVLWHLIGPEQRARYALELEAFKKGFR